MIVVHKYLRSRERERGASGVLVPSIGSRNLSFSPVSGTSIPHLLPLLLLLRRLLRTGSPRDSWNFYCIYRARSELPSGFCADVVFRLHFAIARACVFAASSRVCFAIDSMLKCVLRVLLIGAVIRDMLVQDPVLCRLSHGGEAPMAGKSAARPRKLSVYLYIPNIIGGWLSLFVDFDVR